MRRRRRLTTYVALLAALVGLISLGSRWLVLQLYPLHYRSIIFERAAEVGLDPYLVAAVIRSESHFKPDATSRQGARGLMQVMPDTGQWVADQLRLPYSPDMLYDPDYNIRLGSWYLAHLSEQFDGEIVLALAAYNGGHGNVTKWLQERQWTGEHHTLEQIPFAETRTYVANVMRDFGRYRIIYRS